MSESQSGPAWGKVIVKAEPAEAHNKSTLLLSLNTKAN